MTLQNLEQLEEQIEKPGYLLLLVSVLLFLIIGFVNLIDHTSGNTTLLNKYSVGHVILMAIYLGATLFWASLLFKPNDDGWLKRSVSWLQQRPLLSLTLLAGFALIIQSMFSLENWLNFPALQAVVLFLVVIFSSILLFSNWGAANQPHWWRKVVIYPVALLLLIEIIIQGLTFLGLAPSLTTPLNSFIPFGRIYQADQGLTNTVANSDGWYYPEFGIVEDDTYRIIILGDRSVQGLQVDAEENLGWLLNKTLTERNEQIEVISLGYPDRGPGLYLDPILLDYAIEAYEPDEIIALFDFSNDFQTISRPQLGAIYYEVAEDGSVEIHPNSFPVRHRFQHQVIRAYEGFQPNRFIASHYLTPRVISQMLNPPAVSASDGTETAVDALELSNAFVFNDESNDTAVAVATGLISQANAHLTEQGVKFSLITMPVFPERFYSDNSGSDWSATLGEIDLLLPERQMAASAEADGMPFMSMGQMMQATGMDVAQIQALFYDNDGQLTVEGHRLFAEMMDACFFAETAVDGCSTP